MVSGQVDSRPLWPFVPVDLGPPDRGGLGQLELCYRNSDLQALDRAVGGLERLEHALDADPLAITPKVLFYGLRHIKGDDGQPRYSEEQVADVPSGWLMGDSVQDAQMAALALAFGQDPAPALAQSRAERARRDQLAELVGEGLSVEEAQARLDAETAVDADPPAEAPAEGAA